MESILLNYESVINCVKLMLYYDILKSNLNPLLGCNENGETKNKEDKKCIGNNTSLASMIKKNGKKDEK